jgi:hypothetical protein
MTHTGPQDRPYARHHSRQPPPQPDGGISTGRALGLAIALTLALLAAGTGVLAAAGVLLPAEGKPAEGKPAEGKPAEGRPAAGTPTRQSAPPALAIQPSTPPPPAASLPAPPRQAVPAGQLIAFGATVPNWNAHHRLDPAVAGGTAYNPEAAVAGNGRLADRYVRVLPLNGRILQYTVQLPRGTPFATASAQALAELPADLRLIWRQQQGACTQASYTSPTLARELTDVGDPKGAVLIEYRSGITVGAAYDATDVTSATLSALDAPTAAAGPLC